MGDKAGGSKQNFLAVRKQHDRLADRARGSMTEETFTPALLRGVAGSVDQIKWPAKLFVDNLLSSGDEEIRAFLECGISSMWAYHEAVGIFGIPIDCHDA